MLLEWVSFKKQEFSLSIKWKSAKKKNGFPAFEMFNNIYEYIYA